MEKKRDELSTAQRTRTSACWNVFRWDFSTCQLVSIVFLHFGHWKRWIEAERIAFLNVFSMKEITVGAVIQAARIFRCSAYNATLFENIIKEEEKKCRSTKWKINAKKFVISICPFVYFDACIAVLLGIVGVFISTCEINISSCHLFCVPCFSTILFLYNTLNTFWIYLRGWAFILWAVRKDQRWN